MSCKPRSLSSVTPRRAMNSMMQGSPANPHLNDELLIVRHSGEIPEVALHGSLHYLTAAPDGPGLVLSAEEIGALKAMVVERYREIIGRDLDPANRDLPLYRGLARAAVNWRRLERFCRREGLATAPFRRETGAALRAILSQEAAEVAARRRQPSLNCQAKELAAFAAEVGLAPADLPPGWESLCPSGERAGSGPAYFNPLAAR